MYYICNEEKQYCAVCGFTHAFYTICALIYIIDLVSSSSASPSKCRLHTTDKAPFEQISAALSGPAAEIKSAAYPSEGIWCRPCPPLAHTDTTGPWGSGP